MKASSLLDLARNADAVLFLAAKQAATAGDWLAINGLSGKVIGELAGADGNADLRSELRHQAEELRIVLRQMLLRSCREAEALGFGQTGHESETAAAKKGGNPR